MFKNLGSFVIKYRIPIVIFWVALAAAMFFFAPSLSKTGTMNQSGFLPANSESKKASDLISRYFPGSASGNSGTLVFYDAKGLTDADRNYARQVQQWLLSANGEFTVNSLTSVFNSPEISSRLVSPDGTTMLMNVGLASTALESQTGKSVETIRDYLKSAPDGLEVYVSGSAGIYSDLFGSLRESIDITTVITIALVIVLLLVIYRSPVASLVPLFTIGLAYLVSRGVLGLAAQAGISIWSQIDVFLVVLVFGAGTDYCLFMISRFREELKRIDTLAQATRATVTRISAVITASAFAVIIGLSGMAVARYEMIKTMGPVMAVAILITLIAALTLTPAMASLFGTKLFWPAHADVHREHSKANKGIWSRVAAVTTGHPVMTTIVVLVVMAVPLLALPGLNRSYDQIAELPQRSDSTAGYRVLSQHFNVGEMDPLSTILIAPRGDNVSSPSALVAMVQIANDIRSTKGVAQVQSLVQPLGTAEIPAQLTVSGQLAGMVGGLSTGTSNQTAPDVTKLSGGLARVDAYLKDLSTAFPWVKQDTSYVAMDKAMNDVRSGLLALQSPPLPPQQMAQLITQVKQSIGVVGQQATVLAGRFRLAGDPPFIPSSFASDPQMSKAMALFLSPDGQAAKMYIVLSSSPQSNEALTAITAIRHTVKTDLSKPSLSGYQVAVAGSTATLSDVRTVLDSDFSKVQIVVMCGVFVVFALLLRSLVAPVYLLLTVLLSYATTLGLVTWIFQGLRHEAGVSFIVPIIVFVLLVALGADYNIFLMSRVREESETKETRPATQAAAGATGAVITACGIILAGTFAALTVSPLRIMVQVGSAVAIGILIDTFVVRSLLVPAIATLVGRRNWWPSKFGASSKEEAGRAAMTDKHRARPGRQTPSSAV